MTAGGPDLLRICSAGDSALMVEYPSRIDPAINDRVRALALRLEAHWAAILRDVVIGYSSVTAYFDPLRVDSRWLEAELRRLDAETVDASTPAGGIVTVPVCYDADLGPDLDVVAAFGGISPDEVIALHSGREYRVYMVGFVPGFPYMAEVDPRIAAPRRATPRTAVAAGSVAVAGGQTGIYPSATPGGWNIIGRTPLKPYDPQRRVPALFQSGDRVQFEPIPRTQLRQVS